jgi:cbb3-type cytochrome oxidase subunit 3
MLTKTKVVVMIAVSWLYGVLNYSLIQFTYRSQPRPDVNLVITILAFILPLLVILIMYGKLGKIAFNHRIRIIAIDEQNHTAAQNQSHKNKRTLSLLAELKATRTLAVVVGAFVLCFIGYFVYLLRTTICLEWTNLQCENPPQEVTIVVQ